VYGQDVEQSRLGPPIDVRPLLGPERKALVDLLASLDKGEWNTATPCPGWSVHHLALHLVHDDLRRLSAQRDGHAGMWLVDIPLDELAVALDEANSQWVRLAAPTISPQLTLELLVWLATPSEALLAGLDPKAKGMTVSWAGAGPHPNWLDVAREYTERWVHQQQIRQAVARPGFEQREYLEPVVDTFVRALPTILPPRPAGTQVQLRVTSPFKRNWAIQASEGGWCFAAPSTQPAAVVAATADAVWRRAVRMLSRNEARFRSQVEGDGELTAAVLDLRSAIVRNNAS
jgi:uncharacterized protein (TIGR03083 family)